jgi:hypothetical protein
MTLMFACSRCGGSVRINAEYCPHCGVQLKGLYTPGFGLANLSLILSVFIPVLPGVLCLWVALKAVKKGARIVGWIGVALNAVLLLAVIIVMVYVVPR